MWILHETIPLFRQWSWECEGIMMTVTRGNHWVINVNGKIEIRELGDHTSQEMMYEAEAMLKGMLLHVIDQLDA